MLSINAMSRIFILVTMLFTLKIKAMNEVFFVCYIYLIYYIRLAIFFKINIHYFVKIGIYT